jgi:hypothetical protein
MPSRRDASRSNQKLVIVAVVGVIAAAIGINAIFVTQASSSDRYVIQLQEISDQSRVVTQNYENSIGKWKDGLIGNAEMLQITDNNLEQLQSLLSRLKALEPPEKFREGHEMSVLSLEYELQSNKHMRSYVETGDQAEYEKSTELFQLAFNYESEAFAAFAKANKNT